MRHSGLIMFITIDSVCLFDKAGVCGLKIQFRFQFQYQYQDRVVTIRILLSLTFEGFLARLTLILLFNKMSFVFTLIVFETNFFFVHIVSFRCFFEQFHNSIELKKSHPTSNWTLKSSKPNFEIVGCVQHWNLQNEIATQLHLIAFFFSFCSLLMDINDYWTQIGHFRCIRFPLKLEHIWWIYGIFIHFNAWSDVRSLGKWMLLINYLIQKSKENDNNC